MRRFYPFPRLSWSSALVQCWFPKDWTYSVIHTYVTNGHLNTAHKPLFVLFTPVEKCAVVSVHTLNWYEIMDTASFRLSQEHTSSKKNMIPTRRGMPIKEDKPCTIKAKISIFPVFTSTLKQFLKLFTQKGVFQRLCLQWSNLSLRVDKILVYVWSKPWWPQLLDTFQVLLKGDVTQW